MKIVDNINNKEINVPSLSEGRKIKLYTVYKQYNTLIHDAVVKIRREENNYYAYLFINNNYLDKYLIDDIEKLKLDINKEYNILGFPDTYIVKTMEDKIDEYVKENIILER